MYRILTITPDWIITGMFSGAGAIALTFIYKLLEKAFGKDQNAATLNKTNADALETYHKADMLHFQLTAEFEKRLDERTKDLSALIIKNQVRYEKEIDQLIKANAQQMASAEERISRYVSQLHDALKQLEEVEKKVHNIQVANSNRI